MGSYVYECYAYELTRKQDVSIILYMLTLNAHAKINFFLKVLGKRPDGYHDIESLMLPLELHDRLEIEEANTGISLWCDRADLGDVRQNLVYRAAKLLEAKLRVAPGFIPGQTSGGQAPALRFRGVNIRLYKNTPVAAGLGGGSSDAAATLMGLNKLWGLNLSLPQMSDLAARLGSDVPFFILNKPAIATGRGCEINEISFPSLDIILVNPGFGISTAESYRKLNLGLTKSPTYTKIPALDCRESGLTALVGLMYNSFESIAIPQYPIIGHIKQKLLGFGASGALMSGTGSTVFGVFGEPETAYTAYRKLKTDLPQTYTLILTKTLGSGLLDVGSCNLINEGW